MNNNIADTRLWVMLTFDTNTITLWICDAGRRLTPATESAVVVVLQELTRLGTTLLQCRFSNYFYGDRSFEKCVIFFWIFFA
jgi:hypothetical protein